MRIIHLADTHLGFRPPSVRLDPVRQLNQRECDVYDVWHRAIDISIERDVDAVIHAGDLFDSARPSPRAMSEALDGFARLRDAGIPVIAIAGNHSTPRFRSGGSVFEVIERFGLQVAWRAPQTFRVRDVAFHAVPHESDAASLHADIEALELDSTTEANVLILHAGIEALPRATYGEVNEIELDPELLARVDFDYIALGHLHRFQVPQVNAIYCGSPERLDFADTEGEKAVLEIDLSVGAGGDGFVTRHALDTRPMIDIGIDCTDCDPLAVESLAMAAFDGRDLEGAVVRVRLTSLQRDVYQALDRGRLDEMLEPCLHHQLVVGREGLRSSSDASTPELSFGPWARTRVPAGLDPEEVVSLAQSFLSDAAAEEAETEATS